MQQPIFLTLVVGAVLATGCPLFGGLGPRRAAASPTACDEGDTQACHELGRIWSKRAKEPQDKERALRYYQMACKGGHKLACLDLKRAQEASCGAGMPKSCWALGESYRLGNKAARPNLSKARSYYLAACTEGLARACYQLGLLWLNGKGGPANETRAKHYLGEACKAKHAQACAKLGR